MIDIKYTNIRDIEYAPENLGGLNEAWRYRISTDDDWSAPFAFRDHCRDEAIKVLAAEETEAYESLLFDAGFVRVACADSQTRYLASSGRDFDLIIIDAEAVVARTVMEAELEFFTLPDSILEQHDGVAILGTLDQDGNASHRCAFVPRAAGEQTGIAYYRSLPFYTDDDKIGTKHLAVEIVAESLGIGLGTGIPTMRIQ